MYLLRAYSVSLPKPSARMLITSDLQEKRVTIRHGVSPWRHPLYPQFSPLLYSQTLGEGCLGLQPPLPRRLTHSLNHCSLDASSTTSLKLLHWQRWNRSDWPLSDKSHWMLFSLYLPGFFSGIWHRCTVPSLRRSSFVAFFGHCFFLLSQGPFLMPPPECWWTSLACISTLFFTLCALVRLATHRH